MPEKFVKLNRKFLELEMPDDLKRCFMLIIKNTPCLPDEDKIFICDHIFHYENINQYQREEVLDVLDDLQLFVRHEPDEPEAPAG